MASSGFRRAINTDGGTLQTMWARDIADPIDENVYVSPRSLSIFECGRLNQILLPSYGSHPMYLEHRLDSGTNASQSHGVFLLR